MTRGTESRDKTSLDLEIDRMGASLETEIRSEFLLIRGACLKSQLPQFLRLLEDVVLNPRFAESEVRKLKAETLSALAEEKGKDSSLGGRLFNEFLFSGPDGKLHPYGRSLLGKAKDVSSFTREELKAHHRALLTSDRFVLIGEGDQDRSELQKWAAALASKLPAQSPLPSMVAAPTPHSSNELLLVDKPDRTQAVVLAGQQGILLGSSDYPALSVANQGFGGSGFNSRLMTEIRVKRGWSYGAYSYFKYGLKPRSWTLSFQPATKDLVASLAYLRGLLAEVREKGLSPEEFDIAKRSLINGSGFLYNTPSKRMENAIIEKMLNLKEGFFRSYASSIENLTLDEVNAAFKRFLAPDKMTFMVLTTVTPENERPLATALQVSEKHVRKKDYRAD